MPLIQPTHSLGSSRDKTPTNPKPRFRRNPYLNRCRSSRQLRWRRGTTRITCPQPWRDSRQIRWGEGTTPRGECFAASSSRELKRPTRRPGSLYSMDSLAHPSGTRAAQRGD
jgi:hypothetical protein